MERMIGELLTATSHGYIIGTKGSQASGLLHFDLIWEIPV